MNQGTFNVTVLQGLSYRGVLDQIGFSLWYSSEWICNSYVELSLNNELSRKDGGVFRVREIQPPSLVELLSWLAGPIGEIGVSGFHWLDGKTWSRLPLALIDSGTVLGWLPAHVGWEFYCLSETQSFCEPYSFCPRINPPRLCPARLGFSFEYFISYFCLSFLSDYWNKDSKLRNVLQRIELGFVSNSRSIEKRNNMYVFFCFVSTRNRNCKNVVPSLEFDTVSLVKFIVSGFPQVLEIVDALYIWEEKKSRP